MEPQILTTKLKANVEEFEETITKRFTHFCQTLKTQETN